MKVVIWEKKTIIDGDILSVDIEKEVDWCCNTLKRSDYDVQYDKRFGIPNFDYDQWGDIINYPTTEIKICPFCGDKIETIELKPIIRRGKKEWDVKEIKGKMVIKKNPHYVWEDGTIEYFKDSGMIHTSEERTFISNKEEEDKGE